MAMIEINLLPKQYKKRSGGFAIGKHGVYAVAAGIGVLLMIGAVTLYQIHQISELKGQMEIARARTSQLQKDIQLVDALNDIKTKITDRMAAVEKLDRHRSAWVKLLENLSGNIPDFIWLAKFEEVAPTATAYKSTTSNKAKNQPDTATMVTAAAGLPPTRDMRIEGFSFTLNALASFMIKLMRSDYFDNVDLRKTEQVELGKQKVYSFELGCTVHFLSAEELEKLAAEQVTVTSGS